MGLLLSLLKRPALIACAVLSCAVFVLYFLYEDARNDYITLQNEFVRTEAMAKAEQSRLRAESERAIRESSEGWAAAVAYWRDHPRVIRVRNDDNSSTCLPPVPVASSESDGTPIERGSSTAANAPSEIDVSECEARLNNAVMDAAQVLHLQAFVLQQHAVK